MKCLTSPLASLSLFVDETPPVSSSVLLPPTSLDTPFLLEEATPGSGSELEPAAAAFEDELEAPAPMIKYNGTVKQKKVIQY